MPCLIAGTLLISLAATACGSSPSGKTAAPAASSAMPSSATPSSAPPSSPAPSSAQPSADQDNAALSADELLKQAKRALAGVDTVKVDFTRTTGADLATGHVEIANLAASCAGRISVNDVPMMTFGRKSSRAWLRIEEAGWSWAGRTPSPQDGQLKGKYVAGTLNRTQLVQVPALCDADVELYQEISKSGQAKSSAPATLNGEPAIALTVDTGDGSTATLVVPAHGTPFPLQAKCPGSTASFSAYNSPLDNQEPPAAEVIDLDTVDVQLPQVLRM
ncbi:hypothetical protein [Kitasatospora nipponensis]